MTAAKLFVNALYKTALCYAGPKVYGRDAPDHLESWILGRLCSLGRILLADKFACNIWILIVLIVSEYSRIQ